MWFFLNSLKVRPLSKGETVTVLKDGSGIRCNEPCIPLPRAKSITSVFAVNVGRLRSQVGVSVGQAEENARAANLAHQAGYNKVTIYDPTVVGSLTTYVGSIKVVRVAPVVQRCGVPGCTENHSTHHCRCCGAVNHHLSRYCPTLGGGHGGTLGVVQRCGVPGCTENHSTHRCRHCGVLNQHVSRRCPILGGGHGGSHIRVGTPAVVRVASGGHGGSHIVGGKLASFGMQNKL